jgi:hypothetical protein
MIHHGFRHVDRRSAQPLAPFAYIWGLELSVGAFVKYLWMWPDSWAVQLVLAALAAVASMAAWGRLGRSSGRSSAIPMTRLLKFTLLTAFTAALLILLLRLLGGNPMIPPFACALVLAVGYAASSRRLGKPLLLLGLWLLALAVAIAAFYPGFAGVVLDFFSGLSLIVVGSMIRLWNRG